MGFRSFNLQKKAMNLRSPRLELRPQVRPLVEQLSFGFLHLSADFGAGNFRGVEMIAPLLRLLRNAGQEGGYRLGWAAVGTKSRKLGMVCVPLGSACQNLLGEQRLTPSRNQSFGVQVAWMQRP